MKKFACKVPNSRVCIVNEQEEYKDPSDGSGRGKVRSDRNKDDTVVRGVKVVVI